MEDYGYKDLQKLPQFIATMNSRNNRSIDMKPNHVKKSLFMSILYRKPLRDYKKPIFEIRDKVRFSKSDLSVRKGYKPHLTRKNFETVAIVTKKPPMYTIKVEQEGVICGNIWQKELNRVI